MTGRWYAQTAHQLAAIGSDAHPDGALVKVRKIPAEAVAVATLNDDGTVSALTSSDVPKLWWVESFVLGAPNKPASRLAAFTGHGLQPGTILDRAGFAALRVNASEALAAINWVSSTGQVRQVIVDPGSLRAGIGTTLTIAASLLNVARGLPRFWADANLTESGLPFVAKSFAHRIAPLGTS